LGGVGVGGRGRAEKRDLVAVVKKKEPGLTFFSFSLASHPTSWTPPPLPSPAACLPAWRTCSTDVLECMCLHFLPPCLLCRLRWPRTGRWRRCSSQGLCLLLVAPVLAAAPSRLVAGTGTPWAARRRVAGPSPPHPCPVANQRGRTRAREYGGGRGWSRDRYLRRPPPRAALGWVWCGRGLGRHGVRVRLGIQGRARRLRHPPGGVSSGTTAWLGSAALPAPGPCPRLGPPGTLPRVVLNRRVVTCPHARPTRAAQLESEQRGVPSRQPPPYGVGMAVRAARMKVHPGGASWRELQPRPSDHRFITCHWNWQDDTPYLPLLIFGGGVRVLIFHLMKKMTCSSFLAILFPSPLSL